MQLTVVEFIDLNGKARWGYITPDVLMRVKQWKDASQKSDANYDVIKQQGEDRVLVYLADSTQASVRIQDATFVQPFASAVDAKVLHVPYAAKKPADNIIAMESSNNAKT